MGDASRMRNDLRWLRDAVPLMSGAYWSAQRRNAAAWTTLGLPEDVEEPTFRRQVGRRFEQVHLAGLEASPGVEVLAANRALRGDGRTLGELDALYRHEGLVVHREVAVKYYLAVGQGTDPARWIGPSKRDQLNRKLARLASHQLCLPALAERLDAWPDDLPTPDRSEVLLLGALFSPADDPRLPDGAREDAEHGRWWYADAFADTFADAPWSVIDRPWWLSPEHVRSAAPSTAAALAASIEETQRPRMVGTTEPSLTRAFVVPTGWWEDLR
ncbi:MAG: DUF1853 family protein [Myxococcota bacterium]